MPEQPEPTNDVLVEFAESLLKNLPPRLRERNVLEDAVRDHRETWVTLYRADVWLRSANPSA